MAGYFENTVTALVSELAAMQPDSQNPFSPPYGDVSGFVFEQLKRMPWFFGSAIIVATWVFGASGLWRDGCSFSKKQPPRRKRQVEIWRQSKFKVCRDLMKFYAALVALALYSRSGANFAGKIP
jgi:hypothetical protein